MKLLLELSTNDSKFSTNSLIDPADKHNVSLATTFLIQFHKSTADPEAIKTADFKMCHVYEELYLLRYVIDGLLATYTQVDSNID